MRERTPGIAKETSAEPLPGRRLVLVSNREPYAKKRSGDTVRWERTAGGLVSALEPVMRSSGGVWVAWQPDGEGARGEEREAARVMVPDEGDQFALRRVPLTQREVARYYFGFANGALWPLCHYFVDRCRFAEDEWEQYVEINERFADAVVEESAPGDLVWIHDYQLCLVAQCLRERRTRAKRPDLGGPIAFFLHIPFPSEAVFRILPWRRELLAGLLGADLVGFHTEEYARHFLDCCERLLGATVDHQRRRVRWEGRQVQVGAFPIGIDVAELTALAEAPAAAERASRIRRSMGADEGSFFEAAPDAASSDTAPKVILGVDRLDYSKGIAERLLAVDDLLERRPELRRRFVFLQLAVPSRTQVKEYRDLKRRIDELVGRINGRHGAADWQPIRYLYRSVPPADLVAFYRAADVCLVNPLRDGMNLVAMEYAASRVDGDGVLVLSELTGAAQLLGDGALLINPFAIRETADALAEGLAMEPAERRRRMQLLRRAVEKGDVHGWLQRILAAALAQGRGRATRAGAAH